MSRRSHLQDALAAHPSADWVVPVALSVVTFSTAPSWAPVDVGIRIAVYVGVSTLAGLALAAAVFVCTMVYRSSGPYLEVVRKHFSRELRRNWTAIIASVLVSAVVPLVSLVVDEASTQWALALSAFALSTVLVRFGRIIFWLRYSLFMQHASESAPKPYIVPVDSKAS